MSDWDLRFLGLARYVSTWSKDPSTKVGAVVVDWNNRVMGIGFNGFPRRVRDEPRRLEDRKTKYALMLHAEDNALSFATRTIDCALYTWPIMPCAHCMSRAIQHGIVRVVSIENQLERWRDNFELSMEIATEAGVVVDLIEMPE